MNGSADNTISFIKQNNNTKNGLLDFNAEIMKLFNMSLSKLFKKIDEFLPHYNEIKDDSMKQMSMLSFLISIRTNDD